MANQKYESIPSQVLGIHSGASIANYSAAGSPYYKIGLLERPEIDQFEIYVKYPGDTFEVAAGDFIEHCSVTFTEDDLIMVNGQQFPPFSIATVRKNSHPLLITIPDEDRSSIIELFIAMDRSLEPKRELLSKKTYRLLKIVIVYMARYLERQLRGRTECPDSKLFQKFTSLLGDKNIPAKTVGDYAAALCVTVSVLNQSVKRASGFTVNYHIHKQVIWKAKGAALVSGVSMKTVAYDLGFLDIAHFSKFFRTKVGMTFTDYRRSFQSL